MYSYDSHSAGRFSGCCDSSCRHATLNTPLFEEGLTIEKEGLIVGKERLQYAFWGGCVVFSRKVFDSLEGMSLC